MPENILEQIQAAIGMAVQVDLGTGVDWVDKQTREKFARDYPQLWQVLNNILEMEYETSDE